MSSISILERHTEEAHEPAQEGGRLQPIPRAVRLVGFWSAAVLAVMTIAYAVVQPFTSPPAEWHGMAAYSASFNPVSLTWLYPALLLAPAFVVAMVSVHRAMPEERRLWTQLGVVFACLYAPIQTLNYAVQLLAVAPSIQAGETEGLTFFAFANPHGFFAALEALGYVFMLLALLFTAPAFRGGGLERWLRWTFVATFGIVIVLAVIGVLLGLGIVLIGAITTDAWEVTFAMAMALLAMFFRRGSWPRGDRPGGMGIESAEGGGGMTAAPVEMSRRSGRGPNSLEPARRLSVAVGRLGFWSAALASVFTVMWTIAAVVTAVASPPESWPGIDAYAASFDSRQMLMLVPVLLLATTFVVVMACIHAYASEDRKPWALLALVFAAMYATIASTTYVLQLTVVRQHLLNGQTSGLDLLVSVNPGSVAWALETFGYFFMDVSLVVAAPVFGGGGLERWVRRLFLANGLGLPAAAVYVYTMDALHPLALASLAVWCVTFPIAMGLLAALFRHPNTEEVV